MRSQRPLFAANLNKTEASRHLSRELLVRVALGGLRREPQRQLRRFEFKDAGRPRYALAPS